MKKEGFETPFSGEPTFKPFGLQLDWIYMNGLKPVAAIVEPAPFSDHNSICVHVRLYLGNVKPRMQVPRQGQVCIFTPTAFGANPVRWR